MTKYPHYKVWLNCKIVEPENAIVSIFTQTAMRGANVYEGIRAYRNTDKSNLYVWKLDQHLARLFQSMKIMRMTAPYTTDEYKEAVLNWIRSNNFQEDIHFRVVAYFGDGGTAGLRAFQPSEIDFGAAIFGGPRSHPDQLEHGLHVCVSSWRRIRDDVIPARVKAGANYQNNRLAAMEASVNGYDDAVMLTQEGTLSEGTGAAVMIVRDGILITPSITSGILESITRRTILKMYEKQHNQPPEQRDLDHTELYVADEIFFCGTAEEITPVVSVDRIPVGEGKPGHVTRKLLQMLFDAARGSDPDHAHDLTPVY